MRILPSTGSVERVATARPTMDKPLARFSWRQLTFIGDLRFQIADSGWLIAYGESRNLRSVLNPHHAVLIRARYSTTEETKRQQRLTLAGARAKIETAIQS